MTPYCMEHSGTPQLPGWPGQALHLHLFRHYPVQVHKLNTSQERQEENRKQKHRDVKSCIFRMRQETMSQPHRMYRVSRGTCTCVFSPIHCPSPIRLVPSFSPGPGNKCDDCYVQISWERGCSWCSPRDTNACSCLLAGKIRVGWFRAQSAMYKYCFFFFVF